MTRPRIALGVEYDGTVFRGWQSQGGGVDTVQSRLEAALARVADHEVGVVCAGRTDAGVHALGQVVHFETASERSERGWVMGCNVHLPRTIRVQWARPVMDDFHARFSATARSYRYVILNRPLAPSALSGGRATWWRYALDAARMHTAAQQLLGENDFSSFRAVGCQSNTPYRCVEAVRVTRDGQWVSIDIRANAFLHHMVRNIVGTLLPVGGGERDVQWVGEVLAAKDRTIAGPTAPADGLYLMQVRYPDRYAIPTPSADLHLHP